MTLRRCLVPRAAGAGPAVRPRRGDDRFGAVPMIPVRNAGWPVPAACSLWQQGERLTMSVPAGRHIYSIRQCRSAVSPAGRSR
jgi:hypothetical protein